MDLLVICIEKTNETNTLLLAGNIGLDPEPLIHITPHHGPTARADVWPDTPARAIHHPRRVLPSSK